MCHLQVRKLGLDRRVPAKTEDGLYTTQLSALACLKTVTRNMELITSWFEVNANQSAHSISVTLEQLLSTGRFFVNMPDSAQQSPFLTCVYTSNLSGTATAVKLSMSNDALADFVSKLYLNRHQELNVEGFEVRIGVFLACYQVKLLCFSLADPFGEHVYITQLCLAHQMLSFFICAL